MADAEGADPTELAPLYRVVDTDALDGLFTPGGREEPRTEGTVVYEGYEVTADNMGRVELSESAVEPPGLGCGNDRTRV